MDGHEFIPGGDPAQDDEQSDPKEGRLRAGHRGDGEFAIHDRDGNDVRFDGAEDAKTAAMMLLNQVSGGDVALKAFNVGDERGRKYGGPTPNMRAVARSWDAYIKNRLEQMGLDAETADLLAGETIVRPEDAPQMMIDLKKARFQTGEPDRDTLADEAGYARVTAEVLGVNDGD